MHAIVPPIYLFALPFAVLRIVLAFSLVRLGILNALGKFQEFVGKFVGLRKHILIPT